MDTDSSRRWFEDADDQARERALARAVGADDGGELRAVDLEADILEHPWRLRRVAEAEVPDLYEGLARWAERTCWDNRRGSYQRPQPALSFDDRQRKRIDGNGLRLKLGCQF